MRRGLIVMVLTISMLLTGCEGSLFVEMDTSIDNSAGSGDFIISLSGTGEVNEALQRGDFSDYFTRIEDVGFFVRQYKEGESAFIEIRGSFESLEELNALQAELLAPLKLAPFIRQETRPGLFSARHIYDVTFRTDSQEIESIPAWASWEDAGVGSEQPATFLTYRLSTPGTILSSNALSVEKGAATWTLSDWQMRSGVSLGVLSEQLYYVRIAAAGLVLVSLAYMAYRWLFI